MELRTKIKFKSQQENQIDHTSKILLLGSCFSENIGQQLDYFKFNTLINPFGVLFSPTAIEKVLADTISKKEYTKAEIVQHGEVFHSLHHHSDLSALSVDKVITNIHQAQGSCLSFLKETSHVIITLGTSWVYEYLKNKELVANCHKIPQTEFSKQILSVDEVIASLQRIVSLIQEVNPLTQIIFTVSPVRHTKDGLVENSLSKAHLLSSVATIVKKEKGVYYYGSYEIMLDDLRDYRFYEADLIHPNKVAIDYIWEQFSHVWISEKAQAYFKRIASVQQGKLHKPFHAGSKSHQEFLEKLAVKQNELEKELHVKF
ncbi:GSCFA domain-containing protein [Ochrovirga pacifica]|uniref:GSCFA domain-containing protein n=1 Tax=Ochrovirga pacifica TaxID=1042376 RepID=UPI000255A028|nr:GSCFA domain-containing protein [Ochrovirga pacifica]